MDRTTDTVENIEWISFFKFLKLVFSQKYSFIKYLFSKLEVKRNNHFGLNILLVSRFY
jgi:hypothetical protein